MLNKSLYLSSSCDVQELNEEKVFNDCEFKSNIKFVPFPLQSENCIPFKREASLQKIAKFSLFFTDSITVNGFRLFGKSGHLFTDTSLVSIDTTRESDHFNARLKQGSFEDVSVKFLNGDDDKVIDVKRSGPILTLCSDEPSNFGSWIYRFLPKILASIDSKNCPFAFVYQQPWMTSLIRFAGYQGEVIHHEPTCRYRIFDPIIPSLPVPHVLFRPEIMMLFERLHDYQNTSIDFGERIYVSRRHQALKNPGMRALENETGLVAALKELGFREFIPEQYTIDEQVAVFDRARIIVGAGGSSMFGCIFARHAELIVDIESCDEWIHAHSNLLSSTNASWSMLKGKRVPRGKPPHQNWIIDIETIVEGLRLLI